MVRGLAACSGRATIRGLATCVALGEGFTRVWTVRERLEAGRARPDAACLPPENLMTGAMAGETGAATFTLLTVLTELESEGRPVLAEVKT
mmetsp:Transcript_6212/g.18650  ORF Transcript_6212/g.18650 Transcript_6212/m.18650 type:complete len:91 (-) Transcript_6212:292-564(-)